MLGTIKLKIGGANSRALIVKIRPERDDLRPGWSWGEEGADRWMGGRWLNGWMEG